MAMVSGIRVKRGQPQIYAQLCYTGVPIFHPALKLSAQPERGPLITAGNCHYNPHLHLSPSLPPSLSLFSVLHPSLQPTSRLYSPYSKSTVSSSASIPPFYSPLFFHLAPRTRHPSEGRDQSIDWARCDGTGVESRSAFSPILAIMDRKTTDTRIRKCFTRARYT